MDLKNKALLISIKPEYADKIFSGNKTIELRKSLPQQVNVNDSVLIYVTAPVSKIWGKCKIKSFLKEEKSVFWKKYKDLTGVSINEFDEYFLNKDFAHGIFLKDIIEFPEPKLDLKKTREIIPKFSPPQTYKYLDIDLILNVKEVSTSK